MARKTMKTPTAAAEPLKALHLNAARGTASVAPPVTGEISRTAEGLRLQPAHIASWRRWGPYLAERQWGTVREDYSADGDAWSYFPHDQARWRAYRWGEDGIAGFSDDHQRWCLGLVLWNGRDTILKERMFGLSNAEGNHGEDVKELWWHLDGLPSHALMRMLYKYPQAAYPYEDLLNENARRKRDAKPGEDVPEYEIIDTGVFKDDRYFDVAVDYAKADPDDILMRVTATNRGPETATLHLLPQLWARNIWSWDENAPRPRLKLESDGVVSAVHPDLPDRRFEALYDAEILFCENDTNPAGFGEPRPGVFKDGFNAYLVEGCKDAVAASGEGTRCAALTKLDLKPGESTTLRLRFCPAVARKMTVKGFDHVFADRIKEADAYYGALQAAFIDEDARLVQRRALAGLLWSKQYYYFDVRRWMAGDPTQPKPPESRQRDEAWRFMDNDDVISMPDTWEYPWYASWDLAFHCLTFSLIDPDFAKRQLLLLMEEDYMNPNGQLPAYEWAFSDANPPVQAFAAYRIYSIEKLAKGQGDRDFLRRALHKLMLNFTWWVNREDIQGRNLFQGGFLGMDNIGVFDRSKPLPTGGTIEQADGTAWMATYALDLMRMALELATDDAVYEDLAIKFFDHFLLIAESMAELDMAPDDAATEEARHVTPPNGLWDETDGFFYDVLNLPDGKRVPLRVRSLVGLIPLCAVVVLEPEVKTACPRFAARLRYMAERRPELATLVSHWDEKGVNGRTLLSLLRYQRMTRLLERMFDEDEFFSPYGVRSVSKFHADHPYTYDVDGTRFSVDYEPGESTVEMFGGNSNWRGPIWMPINGMLLEALFSFDAFYGEHAKIETPRGSGNRLTLAEAGMELSRRIQTLFLRGEGGRRPFNGGCAFLNEDRCADLIQFNEYFHGETGKGLGASHQTGWSALVALLLQPRWRRNGIYTPAA